MSIFQPLFSMQDNSEEFWSETPSLSFDLQADSEIYQGPLFISNHTGALEKVEMHFRSGNLYYFTKENLPRTADISWLLLTTFTEVSDNKDKQYGFSLKSNDKYYDFYAESESSLIQWVNFLSRNVVMSDFEMNYMIIKDLDSGQFGDVKLCLDLETNEQFAVKIIEKSRLAKKKMLKCLHNEIVILKKLNHQNIVKLYKVFEDDSFVYLIMEYVKGGNLLKRIESGIIDTADAIIFSKNLVEVVQYVHGQGIIHRDLKPENILLENRQSILLFKLADFGFAYFSTEEDTECSGSPGYIAPEIIKKQQYNSKIDIFSIGVICYEVIARFSPFNGPDLKEIVSQNLKCKINFGHRIFKTVPFFTQNFLKKLLNPNPDLRPTSSDILKNEWRWNGKYRDSTSTPSSSQDTFSFTSGKFIL